MFGVSGVTEWADLNLTSTKYFNDNTPEIMIIGNEALRGYDKAVFRLTFDSQQWEKDLFEMQCIADEIRGHIPMVLEMPYVPNARMDRRLPNKVFTLKTFANIINGMGFDEVVVFDPHSDVTPALIDRCRVEMPDFKLLTDLVKGPVMVFPDAGAMHRYRNYVPKDVPLTFGEKVRNVWTNHISSYELFKGEELRGKDIIIADDIIAHGYTIHFLLEAIMKFEPRSIMIYASHIEDSFKNGILFKDLKENEQYKGVRLFTTPSIVHSWVERSENVGEPSDRIKEVYI